MKPGFRYWMNRSVILKQIPRCGSSAVEKMGFLRSCSIITQRQGQSSMQHLSCMGSVDIWRPTDTRVITICRISNAALAGHMWDVISQMPYRKGKSMITAFRRCREYNSAPSCLIVSGTKKQKIILRSRENSSVLKRRSRYWRHSGIGWINSVQTREPVWRKRWTMPKIGKTPWWPIWKTVIAVYPIILARMQSDHSLLAGKTGCSVPARRELPLALLCIQWLRWQKRMTWIPTNIWHISYHSGQTLKCQMNSWNSLPHGARLRKRTVKTKLE